LFSFSYDRWRNVDLTQDKLLIASKIGKLKVRSICECETNIYDAIYHTTNYLRKAAPDRRRAIILISDNCQADPSKTSPEDCLVELLESSTSLYSIKTKGNTKPDCLKSHRAIQNLAEQTGSEVIEADAPGSLQASLEKAISKIRMQYTIGFNPSKKDDRGIFHKIAVKFSDENRCPECRIIARSGYYTGVSSSATRHSKNSNDGASSIKKLDQLLVQKNTLVAGTADFDDIHFIANAVQQKSEDGKPQVLVNLQIYPEAMNFKKENDRQVCNLQTAIFYADKNGNVLGSILKKIEGSISPKTYERTLKAGIPLSVVIPQKDSIQILRIVVYDESNDMAGSKIVRLPNNRE